MDNFFSNKAIIFSSLFFILLLLGFFLFRHPKLPDLPNSSNNSSQKKETPPPPPPREFAILWFSDFNHNRIVGFNPQGQVVWAQNMSSPPIPESSWYFIGGVERVTVAPNGNLITSYGDAMIVDEIDRATHNLLWQYGTAGIQTYRGGSLDEPHKSWKINDHEVVINDSNDRLVKVVDQNTNEVVWQYGEYHVVGNRPGILQGNTSVLPVNGGAQFLITETLANRIILVDRATKNIVWQYTKPDAKWLENVTETKEGNFILSDRQKGEVFEVNRAGQIVWDLTSLSDENGISYPTDTAVLENGHVLIAEAGKSRIVEIIPQTGQIVRQYIIHGFVSTIAVDYNGLSAPDPSAPAISETETKNSTPDSQIFVVNDSNLKTNSAPASAGGGQTFSGKVGSVNASTGRAGAFDMRSDGIDYGVQVYNYSRVVNKDGATLSLNSIQKGDQVDVTGSISGTYIRASLVKDNSQ